MPRRAATSFWQRNKALAFNVSDNGRHRHRERGQSNRRSDNEEGVPGSSRVASGGWRCPRRCGVFSGRRFRPTTAKWPSPPPHTRQACGYVVVLIGPATGRKRPHLRRPSPLLAGLESHTIHRPLEDKVSPFPFETGAVGEQREAFSLVDIDTTLRHFAPPWPAGRAWRSSA